MMSYPGGVDTPEQKLLFCCARRHLGTDAAAEIADLVRVGIDWTTLFKLAAQHKLVAFLHIHLKALEEGLVPPAIKAELQEHFIAQSRRNLMLTGEVLRLSRLLTQAGIVSLAYKGPVLAHLVYGDVAMRTCSDLDLIVLPKDLADAERILRESGYQMGRHAAETASGTSISSNRAQQAWLELLGYEHSFINLPGKFLLELHWAFEPKAYNFNFSVQEAWEQRVPCALSPLIQTLCPEDLLLALSNHGARHEWRRLEWIAAVSALVSREVDTLNWPSLLERTRTAGTQRILLLTLQLAVDLSAASPTPIQLPESVAATLSRDNKVASLRQQIWQRLFENRLPLRPAAEGQSPLTLTTEQEQGRSLRGHIYMLQVRENVGSRVTCVRREMKADVYLWLDAALQEAQSKQIPQWFYPGAIAARFCRDCFGLVTNKGRRNPT